MDALARCESICNNEPECEGFAWKPNIKADAVTKRKGPYCCTMFKNIETFVEGDPTPPSGDPVRPGALKCAHDNTQTQFEDSAY